MLLNPYNRTAYDIIIMGETKIENRPTLNDSHQGHKSREFKIPGWASSFYNSIYQGGNVVLHLRFFA